MTQTCNQNDIGASCCDLESLLSPGLFKALCEPSRLTLLSSLMRCCEPQSVSQVASGCPLNLSVVSRHLATLRNEGILSGQKQGKEVLYSVRWSHLVERLRAIADAIERCCVQQGEKR